MAFISRPGKEGNATTYQGKVAAGYTNILAQEVDADFDAIYSAWNAGVDTVNIKDQAVTAAKLAPGAVVGSALAPGSVTNAALAANSVNSSNIIDGTIVGADIAPNTLTDSLIASVAWTKLIAPFVGNIALTPRSNLTATATGIDWHGNVPGDPAYDNTKPSWIVRVDYTADSFSILRAPPPGTTFATSLYVNGAGRLGCNLVDSAVARNHIAVNAVNGSSVFVPNPLNFNLGTPGWATVATLPALTTRGGLVHLWAAAGLSGSGASGGNCYSRWICDGTPLIVDAHLISTAGFVPLPNVCWMHNPAAGTHTYAYQANIDSGMTIQGTNQGGAGFLALEVG